jgi:hypothetical protein
VGEESKTRSPVVEHCRIIAPMHWIAPSEKGTDSASLEKSLWDAADQFRANSGLKSGQNS